jgi:hypothetical protein
LGIELGDYWPALEVSVLLPPATPVSLWVPLWVVSLVMPVVSMLVPVPGVAVSPCMVPDSAPVSAVPVSRRSPPHAPIAKAVSEPKTHGVHFISHLGYTPD